MRRGAERLAVGRHAGGCAAARCGHAHGSELRLGKPAGWCRRWHALQKHAPGTALRGIRAAPSLLDRGGGRAILENSLWQPAAARLHTRRKLGDLRAGRQARMVHTEGWQRAAAGSPVATDGPAVLPHAAPAAALLAQRPAACSPAREPSRVAPLPSTPAHPPHLVQQLGGLPLQHVHRGVQLRHRLVIVPLGRSHHVRLLLQARRCACRGMQEGGQGRLAGSAGSSQQQQAMQARAAGARGPAGPRLQQQAPTCGSISSCTRRAPQ